MSRKLFAAIAAAIAPLAVNAAVLVDTAALSPTVVPFSGQGVQLAQFPLNPALLTKVTLEIDATLQADITAENNTLSAVVASAWIIGNVDASGPAGLNPNAVFAALVGGPVGLTASDGNPGTGLDHTDFGGTLSGNQVSSASTTNPGDFGPFLGGGTFDVFLSGTGGWAVFGISEATVIIDNFEGYGTVKVTYEYIPEPHQYAMLGGLGLLGFAAARRFRR